MAAQGRNHDSDAEHHEGDDPRLRELLAPVRLIALDVDGTLTDGSVSTTHEDEVQRFSVRDGFAIVESQKQGLIVAWISGRGSIATERRAHDLRVAEVHLRARDKLAVLREIQARLKIDARETAAMGDDLPDLALRSRCAVLAAPANAVAEMLAQADFVTRARGGEGAVREFLELILRAQGRWQAIVDAYRG